ncbi:MAG TPA: InlB B-repeat-containing protein [Candidatus Acidoferrum sp.]|nr:InlB B-repeat-containing protein [Candidatus Acidoferrum sp.]
MKFIKKALLPVLTLALFFTALAGRAAAADPEDYWTDEGYAAEVAPDYDAGSKIYTISSEAELAWLANQVNDPVSDAPVVASPYGDRIYDGYTFVLSGGLDLSGHFWTPIGTGNRGFGGTFDGGGYTISNMTIGTAAAPSPLRYIGLFGHTYPTDIGTAVIEDLELAGISVCAESGSLSVGGVVGWAENTLLSNCTVSGSIDASSTAIDMDNGIGGLVGVLNCYIDRNGTDIENCSSDVSLTTGEDYVQSVGGLVGYILSGSVRDCLATGTVADTDTGAVGMKFVGGLIGRIDIMGGYTYGNVTGSYATGDVSSLSSNGSSRTGGLIGSSNATVDSCFATGDISGASYTGGLIGAAMGGSVQNAFATGSILTSGVAGGLIGDAYTASVTNCYAAGDIETTQSNGYASGLLRSAYANSTVTYGYWNADADQIVGGTARPAASRVGMDHTTDTSTKKTADEMTGTAFADLLNGNRGSGLEWSSAYGVNGGFPYFEGLLFTAPEESDHMYTVTFYTDAGMTAYKTLSVADGTAIDPPASDPTKAHFSFDGWYATADFNAEFDFDDPITDDTDIYAKWEPLPTYTVTYDVNTGAGTVPTDSTEYETGEGVTVLSGEALTKENFVFDFWTLESGGSGDAYYEGDVYTMGDENVTFFAQWAPTYTVTYDPNTGTGTVPTDGGVYREGDGVEVAFGDDLEKADCRFVGWTTAGDGSGTLYAGGSTYSMGSEDVTFYAKWATTYTATYEAGAGVSGTVPEDGSRYVSGEPFGVLDADGLSKNGYILAGWVDGDGNLYYQGSYYPMPGHDLTLTAYWTNYWMDLQAAVEAQPDYDYETQTYTVDSAEELAWVARRVNSGGYDLFGYTVKIADSVAEINLAGHDWAPIGNFDMPFKGNFDGNGKRITNLRIGTAANPDAILSCAGLFGYAEGGDIANVCLEEVAIYFGGESSVGGLAGEMYNCEIILCSVTGVVSGEGAYYVGGLAGYSYGCDIGACISDATAIGGDDFYVGGLLGYDVNSRIVFNRATGNVTGGYGACAGGLIGYAEYDEISGCFATGDVTGGEGSCVGGFLGLPINYSAVCDSFAAGNAAGGEEAFVGGFAGIADSNSVITNCYAAGDAAGGADAVVGGFGGMAYDNEAGGYWNYDAAQTVDGVPVGTKADFGVDGGRILLLTGKTTAEMKSAGFAALLEDDINAEMGEFCAWASIPSSNDGYPALAATITFDKNGGDTQASPETMTVPMLESVETLPGPPTRADYVFVGWNSSPGGSGTALTADTMAVGHMMVYAQWSQAYIITATAGEGGRITPSGEVSVPAGCDQTFSVVARPGFRIGAVTVDGEPQGVLSSYTFTEVMAAHTIEATFVRTGSSKNDDRDGPQPVPQNAMRIPLADLTTSGLRKTIVLCSDIAQVVIPSNMLYGVAGSDGRQAEIIVSEGDKSSLPEDVRDKVGTRPLISLTLKIDGEQVDWSNPGAPVTVSIPYAPTEAEKANPESIVIWYIDGAGNAACVPNGHYDEATGTVTFTTTHFSDYAVAYGKVSFGDVPAGAWYGKAVSFIAARGITSGTGDGRTYSPDAKLTRGDFLVLMMRAYGIVSDASPADNFADAGDTYYTGYLAAAKGLGITAGVGDNLYAPASPITRQEMFTLLYNALKVIGELPQGDGGKTLSQFADAGQIAPWAKEAMALLVETGTVGGSDGILSPADTTTRAQMAQVLYNLLGK